MSMKLIKSLIEQYPVSRGMLSYTVIWPTAVYIQEKYIAKNKELNIEKMARYGIFGAFYVAPTVYCWMSIAKALWPQATLNHTLKKVLVEQVTYTPFGMFSFYMGMTLLEGKSVQDGLDEVSDKFWPTYQVGAVVWPVAQMVNYTLIAEKNRVPFMSVCSLMWSTFLAYMKSNQNQRDAK